MTTDEEVLASLEQGILLSPEGERLDTPPVEVLFSYAKKSHKRSYDDFVAHLHRRFSALSSFLRNRQELQGLTAIHRAAQHRGERIAVIGMVSEKSITKNGHVLLTIEDPTGELRVLASTKRKELHDLARDVVLDEVLGVVGRMADGLLFADTLLFPDIPLTHELKKGPLEEYVAVIGDPQVGSKYFLTKDFMKMIHFLRGELGNEEQRRIARKIRYVLVPGDLVDGVGVYPGQEEDLAIKDIKEQYAAFAQYLKLIPEHMQILVIPGNHDAGRIAEPQLPPYKDFAAALYAMPNVTLLSNPSLVRLGATQTFAGFTFLLYHGYSLIYYADNVPSIREQGGQKRAELIMRFLLQRRHLAPTHGSNLFIPDAEQDPLVISTVPDFFITGHIHRVSVANYRGVTMVNASAWLDTTDEQERRGLEPQPARLPLINLRTRDVKVINFYSGRGKGYLDDSEGEHGAA